jgi:hypothetical protein
MKYLNILLVNTDSVKKRTVNDVNMPMVRGGLTSANLKLVIDPKASPDLKNAANNFMQNQAIDSYLINLRYTSLVERILEPYLVIVLKQLNSSYQRTL